jgi:hypothetical protein
MAGDPGQSRELNVPNPKDFFIGIADFFGSFVPGAVLVGVLHAILVGGPGEGADLNFYGYGPGWTLAAFLTFSYVAGHLVSVLGSTLDSSYDAVRQLRWPTAQDEAFRSATKIRERELGDHSSAMNTFQWSKCVLAEESQAATDEIARYESASKLFRSLVVVGVFASIAGAARGQAGIALSGVAASALSYLPYVDRRYKSTETAYRFVVALRSAVGSKVQ